MKKQRAGRDAMSRLLRGLFKGEAGLRDLSFDFYCPRTYAHHNRMTYWMPSFYLGRLSWRAVERTARRMLKALSVRRTQDYVIGLNSRLDQYGGSHLLMLDLDCRNQAAVRRALKPYGPGWLFKTARGFHFIGSQVLPSEKAWLKVMRRVCADRRLSRVVDADHLERSLQRGYSTLRLSTSSIKPVAPRLVGKIK